MDLHLPEYEQVVFNDSPLEEVVCQLQFNQILSIATKPPAEFQDRIREQFPVFGEERGIQFSVAAGHQPVIATNEPAWQFKTSDEAWLVSLTSNFVAVKTVAYQDFEDFLKHLLPVVASFEQVYEPAFYTRVGLRYVNRFIRPRKDGQRVPWGNLLHPQLASIYADPVFQDGIAEAKHHLVLQREKGQIGWRYSMDIGEADGKAAERFTLDFDHFVTGQIARNDISDLLADFNDGTYRLFRWCLTEDGCNALKPRPKKGGSS